MSSDRIERNRQFLDFIANPPTKKQRQTLLKSATQDQVIAICEIILNTLAGNVDLTPQEVKTVSVYKKDLRRVGCNKRSSWTLRRKILQRIGKVISFLVSKTLK